MTHQLLAFLRDPPNLLSKVHEQMALEANQLTRTVTCSFTGVEGSRLVIDLLRPRKGDIPRLEVLGSSATVRRLTHSEHEKLAQDLITLRFSKLMESIRFPTNDPALAARVSVEMIATLGELKELPNLHPGSAAEMLDRLWVPASNGPQALVVLKPMAGADLTCDVRCLSLLRQLCMMLATRYLTLVELSNFEGKQIELTYRYHHAVSQSPDRPEGHRARRVSKELGRSIVNRYLRRYPNSVRIHIPQAKKAVHYSSEVTAPPTFFFWRASVVADPDPDTQAALLHPPQQAKWSTALHNGRCAAMFLRNGSAEEHRLYLATRLAEDPNLSAAHNAVVTSFITLVFGMFAMFAAIADEYNAVWAALIVSVLALAIGLVRDHFESPGILRAPLQSIAIRIAIAYLIALYAGWLVSRGSTFDGHGVASWMFDRWLQLGGLALTLLVLTLSIVAWRRFINVLAKYRMSVSRESSQMHLYDK